MLHSAMRGCSRCRDAGFPVTAGAVFSGALDARWMIVGQAPGETESATGVPFSGPSGRRLFRWLNEAGWTEEAFRAAQYITAVTKCYPGKAAGGRGDRAPSRREGALCAAFLDRELTLLRPRVVLAVGRAAIGRFLGSSLLAERVGRAFHVDGRTIVPLPHPSGANLWLNRPENQEHLQRALDWVRRLRDAEEA
jgi:uracil-DNA glycosylase family 4